MSVLVLVRHGQASFLESDYDKLSPLGEQQSRILGSFWAEHHIGFDEVLTGPRIRQIRTAEMAAEAYASSGQELPPPRIIDELDEYDSRGVVAVLMPRLIEADRRVAVLAERYEQSKRTPEEYRAFQQMFELVMTAWVRGDMAAAGLGSWREFKERVLEALAGIRQQNSGGRRIVAFTSGGPISVAVQHALALSDEKTLEINWALRNASVTEFLFTKDRFTLDVFNS